MYTIWKNVAATALVVFTWAFASNSIASGHLSGPFPDEKPSSATPSMFVGTFYTDGGAMVTIHSDGTMEHIVDNMFARGDRGVTPALGVWLQSGGNEIKVTWLRFATEEFGDNFSPNGLISRVSYNMVFSDREQGKFTRYSVDEVLIEQFLPDQNPVTDEPSSSLEAPSNSTGYRLEVE